MDSRSVRSVNILRLNILRFNIRGAMKCAMGLLFLGIVVVPLTIAEPIKVDTSTTGAATGYSPTRNNVYDPAHKLHWTIYHNGLDLQLSASSDGEAWTKVKKIRLGIPAEGAFIPNWSMTYKYLGKKTYLFVTAEDRYDVVLYRVLLGNKSAQISGKQNVFSGTSYSDRYYKPTVAVDDTNKLWIAAIYTNSPHLAENQRLVSRQSKVLVTDPIFVEGSATDSSNDNTRWNPQQEFGEREFNIGSISLFPQGLSKMYLLVNTESSNIVGWLNEDGVWSKSQAMKGGEKAWFSNWGLGGFCNLADEVRTSEVDSSGIYMGGNFLYVGAINASYVVRWDGTNWDGMGSIINGPVNHLTFIDNTLYAAGAFTKPSKGVARWDGNTWRPYTTGVTGTVNAVVKYAGRICVGGEFSVKVGTKTFYDLACWNETAESWEGLDPSGESSGVVDIQPGVAGDGIYTMAVYKNDLYIGGEFRADSADSNTAKRRLVKWNGESFDTVFKSVVDAPVYVLKTLAERLFIGGSFRYVDPQIGTVDRIVSYDGTNFSFVGQQGISLNGTVYDFEMTSSGDLYVVGGSTSIAEDVKSNFIARLTPGPGSKWERLGDDGLTKTNNNDGIRTVEILNWPDSELPSAGGDIYRHNGIFVGAKKALKGLGLASIYWAPCPNTSGECGEPGDTWNRYNSWEAIAYGSGRPDVNKAVNMLAYQGSNMFVGGSFSVMGGTYRTQGIAMFNGVDFEPLGSGVETVNGATVVSGIVNGLLVDGDNLWVGGKFGRAVTEEGAAVPDTNNLALWNSSTRQWSSVGNPGMEVYSISKIDDDIFVTGKSGVRVKREIDGTPVWQDVLAGQTVKPSQYIVHGIAKDNSTGSYYICGTFKFGKDLVIEGTQALDDILSGCTAFSLNPDYTFNSWVPLQQGLFNHVVPPVPMLAYTMRVLDDNLWVGGNFKQASDNFDANYIARWQGTNWSAFGKGLSGAVYTVRDNNGTPYIAGDFQDAGGSDDPNSDGIAVWTGNAGGWKSVASGIPTGIRDLAFNDADIIAGGIFTKDIRLTKHTYLSRWSDAIAADSDLTTQITTLIDAQRNIHMVYTDQLQNLQYRRWTAKDKQWSAKQTLSTGGGITNPSLMRSSDGTRLYLFYIKSDVIYGKYAKSPFMSDKWSAPVPYYEETGVRYISLPETASPDGSSALSFTTGDNKPYKVMTQRISDIDADGLIDIVDDDMDGDGVSNSDEVKAGTSPILADTDSDGVNDGQEKLDGTNPLDAGSFKVAIGSSVCSEWNGFLGITNIVEHLNVDTRKIAAKSTLYNIAGKAQSNPVSFNIAPSGQFDLIANDMKGFTKDSYGMVCSKLTKGAAGSLDGRMVYYKIDSAGKYQFAFAMPFGNGLTGNQFVQYNIIQPSSAAEDAANWVNNWIQVTNLETKVQKGKLYYYSSTGKLLSSESLTVPAGGRIDRAAHTLYGKYGETAKNGIVSWMPTVSSARFQVRNVRYYYDNATGAVSFDSAFQWEGVRGSGERLVLPLDLRSTTSRIEVSNVRKAKTNVVVDIYAATGSKVGTVTKTLGARSSLSIDVLAVAPSLKESIGVAIVKGDGLSSVIATSSEVQKTTKGKIQNVYAIQASAPVGTVMSGSYNTYLNQKCRLLLANAGNRAVKATISMKRNTGEVLLNGIQTSVSANGLVDMDLCSNDPTAAYGVVTVQSDIANTLQATVLRIGADEAYRFPTPVRE